MDRRDRRRARREPTRALNADAVAEWLDQLLQTAWPELRVFVTPVTEQWFAAALAGPGSRAVLQALAPGLDAGNEAFPLSSGSRTA